MDFLKAGYVLVLAERCTQHPGAGIDPGIINISEALITLPCGCKYYVVNFNIRHIEPTTIPPYISTCEEKSTTAEIEKGLIWNSINE